MIMEAQKSYNLPLQAGRKASDLIQRPENQRADDVDFRVSLKV